MFGYLRPLAGELRVREHEQFRAFYCGMCHVLRDRYGFAARFLLNYEFVFLAMLLSGGDESYRARRCPLSPVKKRICCRSDAMDRAADFGVILAYWKIKDNAADSRAAGRFSSNAAQILLSGVYRKAAGRAPEFDSTVRHCLAELGELERERCTSLDMTADKFALILKSAAEAENDPVQKRILSQIFYHIGRLIYILDAYDDLAEDAKQGNYNPLIHRFGAGDGVLSDEDRQYAAGTAGHSQTLAAAAFELMEPGPWTGILENIIYGGLPDAAEKVFAGQWDKKIRHKHGNI